MDKLIVDLNLMPLKENAECLSKVSLSPEDSPSAPDVIMDDELYCVSASGRMNENLEKGE